MYGLVARSSCQTGKDCLLKGGGEKKLHQQPQKNNFFVAVGAIFFVVNGVPIRLSQSRLSPSLTSHLLSYTLHARSMPD